MTGIIMKTLSVTLTKSLNLNILWPSITFTKPRDKEDRKGSSGFAYIRMYIPKTDKFYNATLKHEMVHVFQIWVLMLALGVSYYLGTILVPYWPNAIITQPVVSGAAFAFAFFLFLSNGLYGTKSLIYRMESVAYGESIRAREEISGTVYRGGVLEGFFSRYADILLDPNGRYQIKDTKEACIARLRKSYHRPFRVINPFSWF